MCCFGFWLVLFLCVLFSGMSRYLHTTTQRAKSRPCMVSSLNVTWISGVPHMFIFVRSLFPNVGWHDRVTIITSVCWVPISIAVGSQLTMSHVSVKKTCSCHNQLPGFSFRSCYGSVRLDRGKVANAPNLHFDLRSCSFGGTSHVHLCLISIP